MNIEVERIFGISSDKEFRNLAMEIFRYQSANNPVYKSFINHLGLQIAEINTLEEIPFLPIQFFKTHQVVSFPIDKTSKTFLSSATTGTVQSKHFVYNEDIYKQSFSKGFELFYGPIEEYCFLALLPSYQEREGSSLIYMVDHLIERSSNPKSGYFLNNDQGLADALKKLKNNQEKTVLIGVTYALLDFLEIHQIHFPELIVMETGGMKGRRKEMVREELHQILMNGFGVPSIHSEYGMTELLGQAYSLGEGQFSCPAWFKTMVRDINDPFSYIGHGKTGGLNIVDLSNLYSCSFIATQDLGRLNPNNTFEVLGRFDHADIRGCNLLVQ